MAEAWDQRSADEHGRVQQHVLEGWVGSVASFSAYWRERFEDSAVAASEIASPDDLVGLRPIREIDVADVGGSGGPSLVLRPTEDDLKTSADVSTLWKVASSVFRSGASGKRHTILNDYKPIHLVPAGRRGQLTNAYTRTDLDRLHLAGSRAATVLGLTLDDYVVSAVPLTASLEFWGLYHLAMGASILAAHPRSAGGALGDVLDGFRRLPVTAVAALPSEAVALAGVVGDAGVDVTRVHTVVTVGPPPDDRLRTEVIDAWRAAGTSEDVRCLALWAPPGVRAPWAECAPSASYDTGPGLVGCHTYPDLELLEVLTPAGRSTRRGGGDLTYTSMGWNGTALLRFQTGDYVSGLVTEPCPACGRTVPRVVGPVVPGAWEPAVAGPLGDIAIDLRGAATVLTHAKEVTAWRVDVRHAEDDTASEGYVVVLAGDGLEDGDRLDRLTERLTAAVGTAPLELVLDERASIEAYVEDLGGTFEDSR